MRPITRIETYLATAAGDPDAPTTLPEPKTREEVYLNELCARIADMTPMSWFQVRRMVRDGTAARVFSIGDQLTCQRGNDTLVWDVIGIDHDTPADPHFTHSMTLQLHDCFPTAFGFGRREAFYYAETAIPAGTYNLSIGAHSWNSTEVGKTYQFTTTQEVPAGGQLVFKQAYNATLEGGGIDTFTSPTSTTPIETITMSEGNSGQSLGTIDNTIQTKLNVMQRALFGNNRYKESSIRQWLNSDAVAGSVWSAQNNFDRPPSWFSTEKGFMNGIDSDFLTVIGKTTKVTARNTVCDGGGYDEIDDYFFLPSRSEVYGGVEVSGVNEGAAYPYYSDYSELDTAGTGSDSSRVKYKNGSAVPWWLRTPLSSYASHTRLVELTGNVGSNSASNSNYVAPACNII